VVCGVLGYAYSGHAITQVGVPGLDWLLGFPLLAVAFTAFAAGGVANAINIIDGMNGIALGVILASYARLTQFRWCIGAPTMRAPALAAAQSDVP